MSAGWPIAITGLGLVTPLGSGIAASWRRLYRGDNACRAIDRFDTEHLPVRYAAFMETAPDEVFRPATLSARIATQAIDEALGMAFAAGGAPPVARLFLGSPPFEPPLKVRWLADRAAHEGRVAPADDARHDDSGSVARALHRAFPRLGYPVCINTACATGLSTLAEAAEALLDGELDCAVVVATGASLDAETLLRFDLLGALSRINSPTASRPFCKDRDGFVLGEGAACVVLERWQSAVGRRASILARLAGCAEAQDNYHRTRSDPESLSISRVIATALGRAGVGPERIGYVSAHGTGTRENDAAEYRGLAGVFPNLPEIPVSSVKSAIGHSMTGAALIELVLCVQSLLDQRIPPTINYFTPDPAIPLDVVPFRGREHRFGWALTNSFGFGGQNAAAVVALP